MIRAPAHTSATSYRRRCLPGLAGVSAVLSVLPSWVAKLLAVYLPRLPARGSAWVAGPGSGHVAGPQ